MTRGVSNFAGEGGGGSADGRFFRKTRNKENASVSTTAFFFDERSSTRFALAGTRETYLMKTVPDV